MFETKEEKNYIYLDSKLEDFSNIAVGIIIRALGKSIKLAYIDSSKTAKKLINFIENLSLSYSFSKNFNSSIINIYTPNNNIITKTIIPDVEYLNFDHKMFYKDILNHDLIIFDNIDINQFEKIKLISIIKNKSPQTQIIIITKEKNTFDILKENFDYKIECKHTKNNSLKKINGITSIYGNMNGKSIYAFGELIRKFLYKADVKLIYFNKPFDNFGDIKFFNYLKNWQIENNLYGKFDFVQTGIKQDNQNIQLKKKEAYEALMLFKTSLYKKSPVVADEILNLIDNSILYIDDVINTLEKTKNQVIITGNNIPQKIKQISSDLIKFEKI